MSQDAHATADLAASRYRRYRWQRLARALGLAVGSAGWLWLAALRRVAAVAARTPAVASGAAIVIPGFQLLGDELPQAFRQRLERALVLWRTNPNTILVLSGCAVDAVSQSEALCGYAYLRDRGLPASAEVRLDERARNTEENLRAAAALLGDTGPVVMVSSRWHLARCALLARRLGLPWRICAAERRWRPGLTAWLALGIEALAVLSYFGRAGARFDPQTLLDVPR